MPWHPTLSTTLPVLQSIISFVTHCSPMLLLLSCFSHVRLRKTPQMAAHQAPRPWDSPGKNIGAGCHFLLQCMKVKVKLLSHIRLFATPWTIAHQAPPSMGVSRQEYWSGLPFPSPVVPWVRHYFSPTPILHKRFKLRVRGEVICSRPQCW